MKKGLILLIGITLFSCSLDNDEVVNYQEPLAISEVILPDEFVVGETYEISVMYSRPTNCHGFNDILLKKHDNESTVVVIGTYFKSNGNCTALNTELEATFNIKETVIGTSIYKFWQGKDANEQDIYLIIEVPVVE